MKTSINMCCPDMDISFGWTEQNNSQPFGLVA